MAGNSKDSKILEYKDMINQLNKTIAAQTELIPSLPKTLEEYRLEKEKPILDAFWNWLEQQRPNKGTRLAKAVNYAQNRKDTLMTCLLYTSFNCFNSHNVFLPSFLFTKELCFILCHNKTLEANATGAKTKGFWMGFLPFHELSYHFLRISFFQMKKFIFQEK